MSKRVVDVVVGTILLTLALPIVVLAAIGSAVVLRSWPFFMQTRVGKDGRTFQFVKIRTLPKSCPVYADKYVVRDIEVSAFSRMLRRLHLDELPQLALVVLGRMSLVGPRPEMPGLHRAFDPDFARARTKARPGCTGLWQIGDSCDQLISEAPEFDLYYLEHGGLPLDSWIIARTVRKMLSGSTVSIDEIPRWTQRRMSGSVVGAASLQADATPHLSEMQVH